MKEIESFRKNVQAFSKEHKDVMFKVRCTNYCDKETYYLKNGKFANANIVNTCYAFANNAVKLSELHKDGIYKCTEIERTEKNMQLFNLR